MRHMQRFAAVQLQVESLKRHPIHRVTNVNGFHVEEYLAPNNALGKSAFGGEKNKGGEEEENDERANERVEIGIPYFTSDFGKRWR